MLSTANGRYLPANGCVGLNARRAVGVVEAREGEPLRLRIEVERKDAAVADAVLHVERFHTDGAHNLRRRGTVAHGQDALVVGATHDLGDRGHKTLAELDLALAAVLLEEVAVGQARVEVLARTLELAEVPLLETLDAAIGLAGKCELQRVASALGRALVCVIKGEASLAERRAHVLGLLDT